MKGKEEPVEAFELLEASDVQTRIAASVARGLTRFVGRYLIGRNHTIPGTVNLPADTQELV